MRRPPPRPFSPRPTRRWASPCRRLAFEGPAEQLDLTVNAQPAILATSIALPARARGARAAAGARRLRRLLRRPLDGPVQRDGRGRRALAWRRPAPRPRAWPADAGLGDGRCDGRHHRPDDARVRGARGGRSAVGVFTIANRNSPGQIVVSGERAAVEAAAEAAKDARRQARDRAAGQRRGPLAAHGPRGRGYARASPTSRSTIPRAPLLANADARPLDNRRGLPRRARRAPHPRRRLDRGRRTHDRRRASTRSSRSALARS